MIAAAGPAILRAELAVLGFVVDAAVFTVDCIEFMNLLLAYHMIGKP